jgi:hypothetical protein
LYTPHTFFQEALRPLCQFIREVPLERLNLSRCFLLDDGIRQVCDALKDNETLRQLDLTCNGITHAGADAIGALVNYRQCIKWYIYPKSPAYR